MTHDMFNEILESRITQMRETLSIKAMEYSQEDERLHNFYEGAAILGNTPREYCLNLMTKHLACVFDIARSEKSYPPAFLDEKFGDAINYLVLLQALVVDA